MSFLGMAFEMAAIDESMSSTFDKISDAYEKMAKTIAGSTDDINDKLAGTNNSLRDSMEEAEEQIEDTGKAGIKFGKTFNKIMDGVMKRVTQFNVASIADGIQSLTGETGNLSNGLESTMAGMIQSTKPIAATLNLTGKEMKQFASRAAGMAYGMNTSADAVAETMKAMHVANKGAKAAMDELGMSTKDWVKVVQTTNVPMGDYTAILGDMTTSWGASPKEAAKLIDNLMAIGKVAGTGTGAIKNAKVQLDQLGDVFKDLPPSMARSSKEITGLMESSARMSGVFRQMGDTQEEAISKGNTVARMFAEQDVAISKALAIGDDKSISDNPLMKYLMRLGVGFDEAKGIVATGSRDSVKGMQMINDVYAKFGSDASPQVQRALSGLSGALGEGAAGLSYLAQNTTQGTEALKEMSEMAVKGDGALKQFGKDAYSSGLTLQDTYDRAKEAFDTTIRSVARANVRGLVSKQIAGMREAGKEIKALGSDETWGPLVKAVSQYKQMGVSGLFASFADQTKEGAKNAAKFGAKAGLVFDTIKQFGSDLGPLMQMVGMLGPAGVIGAGLGIAGLFVMDKDAQKAILGPVYDTFEKISDKIKGVLGDIEWGKVWKKVKRGAESAFDWLVKNFPWRDLVQGMGKVMSAMADIIKKHVDFGAITDTILGMVAVAAPAVFDKITGFLVDNIPAIGNATMDMVKRLWGSIGESFGSGGQVVAAFATAAKFGILGAITEPLMGVFKSAGAGLLGVMKSGSAGFKGGLAGIGILAGFAMGKAIESALNKKTTIQKGMGVVRGMGDIETYLGSASAGLLKQDLAQIEAAINVGAAGSNLKALTLTQTLLSDALKELELDRDAFKAAQNAEIKRLESELKSEGVVPVTDPGYAEGSMVFTEEESWAAGSGLAKAMGDGYAAGAPDAIKSINEGQDEIAANIGQSLPTEGPLADGAGAYNGGYDTMMAFADGVTDSTEMVRIAVEQALEDSVILTMDTYATKMKELAEQKTFLASVAKSMVRSLGSKIETHVDSDADVNVRKNFELAMNLPGLSAVVLAVSNEGSMTRKMLKRIYDENVKQTIALQGGATGAATDVNAGPPSA